MIFLVKIALKLWDMLKDGKTTLKDVNFKWTSLSPDIMDNTGKIINHPGNETKVKYKVEVTYKDSTKVFEFESILDELEK